jgi:hypothetical protein
MHSHSTKDNRFFSRPQDGVRLSSSRSQKPWREESHLIARSDGGAQSRLGAPHGTAMRKHADTRHTPGWLSCITSPCHPGTTTNPGTNAEPAATE